MYLSKLKCNSLIQTTIIFLIVLLIPGCLMMLLAGSPFTGLGKCIGEIEIRNDKIDYIEITSEWAKKNGYDILLRGPNKMDKGYDVIVLKKKYIGEGFYNGIVLGRKIDKSDNKLRISSTIDSANKFDQKKSDDLACKLMNDFKEKYLAEISKAE